MTWKRRSTSPASRTADGSSMMMSFASWESARAIETICWPAAERSPTSVEGEISVWPRRLRRAAAALAVLRRWEKPKRERSWPR